MELIIRVGDRQMKDLISVPFYISAVPAIGQTALWTCYSPFLGKGYVGEYRIENFKLPSCDIPWKACDLRLSNPIAIFHDFGSTLPFLTLYGFNPQAVYRSYAFGDKFHRDKTDRQELITWKAAKKY